jgi:hypothetical protein
MSLWASKCLLWMCIWFSEGYVVFLFFYSFIHMCIHCLGHFSPLYPTLSLSQHPHLASRQSLFCPFIQFCWREDISNNKTDKEFLLLWDKHSCIERFLALLPCTSVLQSKLIHLYLTFSLLPRSPSHIGLCHFKVSVLAPLQWGHQTLSSFGFPTYPYSSRMCSPLSVWPKFNHIVAFALDLKSTYEGEHMVFGLLSLAYLAQDDVLEFHPFTCE